MALPLEDRASLRSLLAAKFPKADDMANAFFMRMETAILDYAVRAAYVESIPGSDREFRANCLSVAKHADALVRLLDGDGAFPNLLALEITPTRLVRKRNSALQMQDELKVIFGREVDIVEKDALKNPFRRHSILTTKQVVYAD